MLVRHARAFPGAAGDLLPVVGLYAWRRDGEHHQWNPETIALLQHAVRGGGQPTYDEFAATVNADSARRSTLRGLLRFRTPDGGGIPLEEVEPAAEIVKRFSTGAMSLGSLSREAHETLAVAMNRIGGRSNTGEGGEDPVRFTDERRSKIKQVASGRFGVNIDYLTNADELQIKMAQGAKPGEGGQLPGHKVDRYIAGVRLTTPGVGLISPPPHHDIYSIEDLKQLIYDLRCANPEARISVKLVAEVGVGTVAAGVAKSNADHVLISGHDGGTGASPISSILHAGVPWEIGLAETQQTLVLNDLRVAHLGADRRAAEDGPRRRDRGAARRRRDGLRDGAADRDGLRDDARLPPEHLPGRHRDPGSGAAQALPRPAGARDRVLLPRRRGRAADHGVARCRPLRGPRRPGRPARAGRGARALAGTRDRPLEPAARARRAGRDGAAPGRGAGLAARRRARLAADRRRARRRWTTGEPVDGSYRGAQRRPDARRPALARGHEAPRPRRAAAGDDPRSRSSGSAGQSFGAWLAPGIELTLTGEANDYAGKGLSGGTIAVRPPAEATFAAEENVIVGNTVLYGATAGRAFFRGLAGERFAVRNSGASAVVEGVGDHGCEYMTGGHVVVLGPTGRNFAAGMSGGIAYVLDEDGALRRALQPRSSSTLEALDDDDVQIVLAPARRARGAHRLAGRGARARRLEARPRFVKVIPHDYKRALADLGDEVQLPRPSRLGRRRRLRRRERSEEAA